jgi:hypothetical protein
MLLKSTVHRSIGEVKPLYCAVGYGREHGSLQTHPVDIHAPLRDTNTFCQLRFVRPISRKGQIVLFSASSSGMMMYTEQTFYMACHIK